MQEDSFDKLLNKDTRDPIYYSGDDFRHSSGYEIKKIFERPASIKNLKSDIDLQYFSVGLDYKLKKKIQTGKLSKPQILDLHGESMEESLNCLVHFFNNSTTNYLKIICGKGIHSNNIINNRSPLQRTCLNFFYLNKDKILAWCLSSNYGSFFVYLKNV